MKIRNLNHGFGRRNQNFIIFAETARIIEPSKSAFDDPTLRNNRKAFGNNLFGNICIQFQNGFYVIDKRFAIAFIGTKFFDSRIFAISLNGGKNSCFCIVKIGFMNLDSEQTAQSICYRMSFTSFRFFPPS